MRNYRRELYKSEYHSRIKAFPLVEERVNKLEKLFHKTAANPNPKYASYFHGAITSHPSFRKFLSYLRRAAVQDAKQYFSVKN